MSAAGGPLLPPPAPPTDQQRADHEAGVLAARMRERFTTSRSSDAPAIAPPRPSALPKSVEEMNHSDNDDLPLNDRKRAMEDLIA